MAGLSIEVGWMFRERSLSLDSIWNSRDKTLSSVPGVKIRSALLKTSGSVCALIESTLLDCLKIDDVFFCGSEP